MGRTKSSIRAGAVMLAAVLGTGTAQATVLAQCGPSSGKSYFEDFGADWRDDAINDGSNTFLIDAEGKADILFTGLRGNTASSTAQGAEVYLLQASPDKREFVMLAFYPRNGVTETYSVVAAPGGTRRLLWTANKPSTASITRVSAFVAACD